MIYCWYSTINLHYLQCNISGVAFCSGVGFPIPLPNLHIIGTQVVPIRSKYIKQSLLLDDYTIRYHHAIVVLLLVTLTTGLINLHAQ